jgi:signal transduction histidine kinase
LKGLNRVSHQKRREGAGLGLAIVKEICIFHQANISLSSAAAKTCFQFRSVR